MSEIQIVHTSSGLVYTRRKQRFQCREHMLKIAPRSHGADNYNARIANDEMAMAIYNASGKYAAIALEYGVSPSQVGKIKRKVHWAHIHE
jgi:hypothetical protein